ncbi:MAG: hypothetical protein N3E36_06220 [Sulfolobales archaeon]|nr:hypothetical protein [Sulfolobales archaeon]MCX8199600.1 hypothetical protein [Sulfolobales archaeon]MDW8170553.1 DNA polymerase sliding clamp [Desulfurococcaceae archaeon]
MRVGELFKLTYSSALGLRSLVQLLSKATDEVPFLATPSSLEVKVLSPDKTSLMILQLPAIAFEEYVCDIDEFFVVATDELMKVVRRGGRNDGVSIELNKALRQLKLVLKNKKTGVERAFNIELKERVREAVPELSVELSVSVRILARDFKDLVKDLKIVGEEARFTYSDGKLYVKAYGYPKEYEAILEEGNPLVSISSSISKAEAAYSIAHLEMVARASSMAEVIDLMFDTDKPLKLELALETGGRVIYWIAPRTM